VTLKVYDTMTKSQRKFIPRDPGKVSIYVCGVTPYNFCHIGNARPFLVWDVIQRYLSYKGYRVRYVQNFTDVDDKIIKRAQEEGVKAEDIADRYIKEYFHDMDALGIQRVDVYPRVTDHIPDIIELVEKLVENGNAYELDGTVYYSVQSFPQYGKLSGRSLEDLKAGARVEVDERKRHPMDFVLWKPSKENEPAWDSPWGLGRPGWHIECSVMALKYLGPGFDFHGGGSDLIFPHHENEVAQSEAALGSTFVRYWVHNGFINMGGEKMAKSVGNITRVRDLIEEYPGPAIRYYILSTHYRSPLDFRLEDMPGAVRGWKRLVNLEQNLDRLLAGKEIVVSTGLSGEAKNFQAALADHKKAFESAMDDDFNTAQAIGVLFDLARDLNSYIADGVEGYERIAMLATGRDLFLDLGGVLGLLGVENGHKDKTIIDGLVQLVAELRQDARARQDYDTADRVRQRLGELGIALEDTAAGVRWRYH
jgi:cysteinyl-tRNA synthetase